ncbi:hypothetical protein MMC20_006090 [Loxospora ochrophaea]|nr:hypothetical protein [Loxospora ochrophaea]
MSVPKHFKDDEYEHDPRWSAVDAYAMSHLHSPSSPNQEALDHALEHSRNCGLPDISVYPAQGKLLALNCLMLKAKHALEIGTLGAYSTIWLTTMNPSLRVTSLEINPKHAEVARQNLEFAGVSDRVEVLVGNALELLPELYEKVKEGTTERFEFVFIDANKSSVPEYFDWGVKLSTGSGACLHVDNMVGKGNLANKAKAETDANVQGGRKLVEALAKDDRVEATIVQTVAEKNYDGFLMAVVK